MASALVALATTTLTSSSATVTFSSIPGTYRDLRIVWFAGSAGGNQDIGVKFNTLTGTSHVFMAGFGSSTGSGTGADLMGYVNSPGLLNQVDILDYAQTDKHKSGVIRYGADSNFAAAAAFRWANTAAITSIQLYLGSSSFTAGSVFSLYGVSA